MKSEQEIIEEIINSVKSRKFRAWIYNLTFSEDDWEDDFDTMIEATEALNDALDDNGREDCEWGIDEVKTYNQIQIELAVKKALQKGKELGANECILNECILEGKPDKGHPIPVYCPACFDESIEKQASKIEELQSLNDQLTDANREHNKRIAELEKENIDLKKQLSKMNSSLQVKLNKTRKLATRYNKALAFRKKDSVSLSCLRLEISKLANELEKEDMRNITVSYVQNLVKRLRGEK